MESHTALASMLLRVSILLAHSISLTRWRPRTEAGPRPGQKTEDHLRVCFDLLGICQSSGGAASYVEGVHIAQESKLAG